jgi:hypothetical protein
MPRSKEDFRKAFRERLAGVALYGLTKETTGGVLARASHALTVCENIDELIDEIYAFIVHGNDHIPPIRTEPPKPAGPILKPPGTK